MPNEKLTPEGEVIAAYGAATVAAFQVLVSCLEENEAIHPGQFPAALAVYTEMVKSRKGDVSDMTLAVLHDISRGDTGLVERAELARCPLRTGPLRLSNSLKISRERLQNHRGFRRAAAELAAVVLKSKIGAHVSNEPHVLLLKSIA